MVHKNVQVTQRWTTAKGLDFLDLIIRLLVADFTYKTLCCFLFISLFIHNYILEVIKHNNAGSREPLFVQSMTVSADKFWVVPK